MERTRDENGNSSAIIVCHSYGCPFMHYFLSRAVNQAWKDTNVKAIVGVAGAWGGHYRTLYKYIGDANDDLLTMVFPQVKNSNRLTNKRSKAV